jgi:peptidoglycan-associated lipoprotein
MSPFRSFGPFSFPPAIRLFAFVLVALSACSSNKSAAPAPTIVDSVTILPPTPAPAGSTATGVYIDPTIASACGIPQPKMFFPFDSADLKVAVPSTIDDLSQCVMSGALKGKSLDVVGRTDPRGTDDYNQKLGKSRADSVAEVLTAHGLAQTSLKTRSTGEEKATGNDENGWANDRRVDIRLAN